MQNYSGFSGRIRILKERIQKWISKNGEPPVGSRAWEAKLEVEKLPRIIDERLERLSKGDLDADAQANLRADIENLQQQLATHQKTLDEMDTNPGRGFVAADGKDHVNETDQEKDFQPKKDEENQQSQQSSPPNHPGVELHNHLSGILTPDQLIKLAYQDNYHEFISHIWSIEALQKNPQVKSVFGDLVEDGRLDLSKATPEDVIDIATRLLSANESVDFGLAYTIRGQVIDKIKNKEAYLDVIVKQLSEEENIRYLELQAEASEGINLSAFKEKCAQKEIQVRFLLDLSTSTLRGGQGKRAVQEVKFGEESVIGVDFAGPEKRFDSNRGMDNLKNVYRHMAAEASKKDSSLVLRIHVGEGFHERDKQTGQPKENSQHRKEAEANLTMVLKTLEELTNNGELSNQVIVRFGHATHATPKQLQKIKELESKGLQIIVEANLTSNLTTRSINLEEQNQILLKFLYHDINTILNTDAGGVMGTTIATEYRVSQQIIDDFKAGITKLKIGNKEYNFEDLSTEQQKNFDTERLRQNAEKYRTDVAPTIKDEDNLE
jgi:hypothetical protein